MYPFSSHYHQTTLFIASLSLHNVNIGKNCLAWGFVMKFSIWLFGALLALSALPVLAQETSVAENTLPTTVTLEGFTWIHQGVNRCSAAALSIHLSYFMPVTADTYFELAREDLNTWGADASVRIEEMAAAARQRGLGAVVRRGGTSAILKQLVAGGFPVLVENSYFEGDDWYQHWLSHNRILVGYDDVQGVFFFQDPLLGYPDGALVSYSYADFDERWRAANRDYLVIYRPEDEAAVQAILGDDWDESLNAQNTLAMAEAEILAGLSDGFVYQNMGWALLKLERYEEAAVAFDNAVSAGLPLRMFWYEFGIFEAYLAMGRFEDVVTLANVQIINAGDEISVEEWYYYAALAYEGLNNRERALINYEVAVTRNSNFVEAAARLQTLRNS
jgi:tetratricopeptide (TPR) repeat protein